jgi:hypothetical protein
MPYIINPTAAILCRTSVLYYIVCHNILWSHSIVISRHSLSSGNAVFLHFLHIFLTLKRIILGKMVTNNMHQKRYRLTERQLCRAIQIYNYLYHFKVQAIKTIPNVKPWFINCKSFLNYIFGLTVVNEYVTLHTHPRFTVSTNIILSHNLFQTSDISFKIRKTFSD